MDNETNTLNTKSSPESNPNQTSSSHPASSSTPQSVSLPTSGAYDTPDVTTLDDLSTLSDELSNYAPASEASQSTAPIPGDNQNTPNIPANSSFIPSNDSVSATPVLGQSPINSVQSAEDFASDSHLDLSTSAENHEDSPENPTMEIEESEDAPLKPSEPVPGSIGSAKSYVDPALAPATKPKKKISTTAILVIILVGLILLGAIYFLLTIK